MFHANMLLKTGLIGTCVEIKVYLQVSEINILPFKTNPLALRRRHNKKRHWNEEKATSNSNLTV